MDIDNDTKPHHPQPLPCILGQAHIQQLLHLFVHLSKGRLNCRLGEEILLAQVVEHAGDHSFAIGKDTFLQSHQHLPIDDLRRNMTLEPIIVDDIVGIRSHVCDVHKAIIFIKHEPSKDCGASHRIILHAGDLYPRTNKVDSVLHGSTLHCTLLPIEQYRTRGRAKFQPRLQMEVALTSTTSVAIVTDSAAGLPTALLERYNIAVVPFWMHMGNESYLSGETLDPPTFFRRLRAAPELEIHTGVPGIAKFVEIYRSLATKAQGIVSIHITAKQSGTCSAAEVAARESPVPVVVVDTGTTAMAEGFTVLAAARAAQEGNSLEQVIAKARAAIPNTGVTALLENVTCILKGGRLSAAAGRVGSMLRIQPLVRVKDNKVSLVGQVRKRSKGIEALIEKTVDEVRGDAAHLTVHFAEAEDEGQRLLDSLRSRINCVESYLMRIPIELGVHAGPGSIGVAYHIERENTGLGRQVEQKLERIHTQAKEAIRSRLP